MDTDFDVVIIGAGPAGAAAASTLAPAGLRVAVLEKGAWPRRKPCGGALPFDAAAELELDWSTLNVSYANRVESRFRGGEAVPGLLAEPPIALVHRAQFDAALLARALELGGDNARFMSATPVRAIQVDPDGRCRVALADGKRLRARYIIAACGAHSPLLRAMRAGTSAGLGIECELRVRDACFERHRGTLRFDYGRARGGYAWMFPKDAGRLSCGIGGRERPAALKRNLQAFLSEQLEPADIVTREQRGHPMAAYSPGAVTGEGPVLLAGDAGALVDPVSGEGIWYALRSGDLAARSLLWCLGRPDDAVAQAVQHLQPLDAASTQARRARPTAAQVYAALLALELTPTLSACAELAVPDLLQAPHYFYRRFLSGAHSYPAFYTALRARLSGASAAAH